MSYQLKEVIADFLREETITRMSIKQIKVLPKILIKVPLINQQMYDRIRNHFLNRSLDINTLETDTSQDETKAKMYFNFLSKILNDRKFDQIDINYENCVKSCQIVIRNKKITCPEPELRLDSKISLNLNFYFGHLNDSFKQLLHYIDIESNLKIINFEFPTKSELIEANIGTFSRKYTDIILAEPETYSNVFFRAYSIQKLNKRNDLCDSSHNHQIIYSSHEPQLCHSNCIIDILIREYECLLRDFDDYFIDLSFVPIMKLHTILWRAIYLMQYATLI